MSLSQCCKKLCKETLRKINIPKKAMDGGGGVNFGTGQWGSFYTTLFNMVGLNSERTYTFSPDKDGNGGFTVSWWEFGGDVEGMLEGVKSASRHFSNDEESVGEPGTLESVIPVWGSGRSAVDNFQKGNFWTGLGYSALAITDVFLVKSLVTGVGKLAVAGVSKIVAKEAVAESGEYLYHYASTAKALNASETGLRVGEDGFSYLTNVGDLSPLQAQIELALPANRSLPPSLLKINVTGLEPSLIRRDTGNLPGLGAGGGMEFLFNSTIGPERITMIR